MANSNERDDAVGGLLDGWGTPDPNRDFADGVLRRVHAESVPRRPSRRRWVLPFVLGGVFGGLVTAASSRLFTESPRSREFERPTHLQVPGVVDVVGEAGSRLRWHRNDAARIVVEVVQGVAWIRTVGDASQVTLVAGDGEIDLARACSRVEVARRLLSVETTADTVDCDEIDAAIERARAEPSGPSSR